MSSSLDEYKSGIFECYMKNTGFVPWLGIDALPLLIKNLLPRSIAIWGFLTLVVLVGRDSPFLVLHFISLS